MQIKYLVLRNEYKKNEYRVALIPNDCKTLINNNFIIYVESSKNRCFSDELYKNNGCIIIDDFTKYNLNKGQTLIIGLKELDYNNLELFCYKHLYFSHTFKDQSNSKEILQKFKIKKGLIYDLEYLIDDNNKRLVAFGFWAGFIGTAISLLQYYYKFNNKELSNLTPYNDYKILIEELKKLFEYFKNLDVGIIGINGRCGEGCKFLLDKLSINYVGYLKGNNLENLINHNIIINCIKLETNFDKIFISNDNIINFKNLSLITDVSCDIFAVNNPIKLNYNLTTFQKPVFKLNQNIDIICIDNLPSLLPIDSSTEFSNKLTPLILMINNDNNILWNNLEILYYKKINIL
jgi:saccharopine dehydrogenase (NAD+, L-lysine-forming)